MIFDFDFVAFGMNSGEVDMVLEEEEKEVAGGEGMRGGEGTR